MPTVGNVVNLVLLLIVLVVAGQWSFGLYGAIAGLLLAIIGMVVVLRLLRSARREQRFDPAAGNSAGDR